MTKRTFIALAVSLFAVAALATGLVCLTQNAHDNFEKTVTIDRNGTADETFSVAELVLNPSESKEEKVHLACEVEGEFAVSMDFVEKEDGGLKPFVDVTVSVDGREVYSGTLSALLTDKQVISFTSNITAKQKTTIVVRYTMPEAVGNEAKNTSSLFDTHIKIQKI